MRANLKYNRGRVVDGHWMFGGMERGSGDRFNLWWRSVVMLQHCSL